MDIQDLQGKLVAVLGYGMEGKATARFLLKHGISPVLFDHKPWEEWDETEKLEIKKLDVNFVFGPDCLKELAGFDVAFRSPGIQTSQLTINNLRVTSQTKWFFEHCPAKIIGITGTKGKGTTSTLIYEMLEADQLKIKDQGSKIFLTGNIGKIQPFDFLDNLTENDWVVYELSSFQLQDLDRSPHIGVVLMVTSEHLDYHSTVEEYREAKTSIVKFQTEKDFAIVNADYEASVKIGELGKGAKLYFSKERAVEQGCYVEGDDIMYRNGEVVKVLGVHDLQLRGRHNLENVCAATAAARAAGVEFDAIRSVLTNFQGLEHRLEFVAEKNGVKYYNDSFSTTPETAIAAIKSFVEPLIVIVGGSSKNSDFTELASTIISAPNIKAVILVGPEGERIGNLIQDGKFSRLTGAQNMTEIFDQVESVAASNDVVLLSPACASFGMFKNYKDRGEQFREQVKKL